MRRERNVPAVERQHFRPVDRPHGLVMQASEEACPPALDRGPSCLARHVADGGRSQGQKRLAGHPDHLQKGVDRPVEGLGEREQALGRSARDDLPDRPEWRSKGSQQGESPPPRDDVARRLQPRRRQERVVPAPPLCDREIEQRREQRGIDRRVVLEYECEVVAVNDDPPPGCAMAQEGADLRQAERKRIARREPVSHISRLDRFRRQEPAVDSGQHLALDRQMRPQGLDARPSTGRAFQVDDESLGGVQDWPFLEGPDKCARDGRERLLTAPARPRHPDGCRFHQASTHDRQPAEPPALPIAATVICKNEEACVGKCLASLEGLAEIVVVDSGSTDGTLAIVDDFKRQGLPIRLIHQPWLGYAGQKQFALEQAGEPWILSIDADEWLDDDLRAELPRLIAVDKSVAGWKLRRTLTLFGYQKPVSLWTRPELILRLVRRGRASFNSALLVHEGLIADGETGIARKGLLRHERGLPLDEQMKKEIVYARLKAEQRLNRGRKPSWLKLVMNPSVYFLRIFFWNRFFLCGWAGFIHAITGATYSFMAEAMHRQFYYARKRR